MDGDKAKVIGLSKEEVIRLVQSKYPQATTVEVEEFRPNRISVLGEVFHQLNSELADGPMRVMDAIAAANGFTPLANQRRVKLVRQNAGRVEVYELDLRQMMKGEGMKQNLLLRPGDVITVPRNFL
jgi:protein involved in polysaccharide export with SLBB domain